MYIKQFDWSEQSLDRAQFLWPVNTTYNSPLSTNMSAPIYYAVNQLLSKPVSSGQLLKSYKLFPLMVNQRHVMVLLVENKLLHVTVFFLDLCLTS